MDDIHIKIPLVLDNKGNWYAEGDSGAPLDYLRSKVRGAFGSIHLFDQGDIVQEVTVDVIVSRPSRPMVRGRVAPQPQEGEGASHGT